MPSGRAEHLTLGTQVAIKLIDPSIAKSEEALTRFRREAQAAAELRSAHVVHILDYEEGDRANVTLHFRLVSTAAVQPGSNVPNQQNNAQSPQAGAPAQSTEPLTGKVAPQPAAPSGRSSTQKTIGWIGIGVGGAGLIVGGVTGFMAMSKRSSLSDSGLCSADLKQCDSGLDSKVSSYNGLRAISTIGFYAGGVLAAAGVTLLLTSPKQESKATVGLWLNPNGAGLTGGF